MDGAQPFDFILLPETVKRKIIDKMLASKNFELKNVLDLSVACKSLRPLVLARITTIYPSFYGETVGNPCYATASRPAKACRLVEGLYQFLGKVAPVMRKMYLPQVAIHYRDDRLSFPLSNQLDTLVVTICQKQDIEFLKSVCLNAPSLVNLTVNRASKFCVERGCDVCRKSGELAMNGKALCDAIALAGPRLKTLALPGWDLKRQGSTERAKKFLGSLSSLRAVDFTETDVGRPEIEQLLSGSSDLRELRVEELSYLPTDLGLRDCSKNLKVLVAKYAYQFGGDALETVAGLTQLTHLKLTNCLRFTDFQYQQWALTSGGNLRSLVLYGAIDLRDFALDILITDNPGLENIQLEWFSAKCRLTDAAFKNVGKLRHLKYFLMWINPDPRDQRYRLPGFDTGGPVDVQINGSFVDNFSAELQPELKAVAVQAWSHEVCVHAQNAQDYFSAAGSDVNFVSGCKKVKCHQNFNQHRHMATADLSQFPLSF